MAEKFVAYGTVRVGGDEPGDVRTFEHGEELTDLSDEQLESLKDAGAAMPEERFREVAPEQEDELALEEPVEPTQSEEGTPRQRQQTPRQEQNRQQKPKTPAE